MVQILPKGPPAMSGFPFVYNMASGMGQLPCMYVAIHLTQGLPLCRASPLHTIRARHRLASMWVRFRKRWNLTLGRLPAKDILPAATMQAKACAVEPENENGVPPVVQFWGPQGGPH